MVITLRGKKASAIVLIAVLVVAVVGVFLILSGMPGGPTGASVKRFRSDSFPHQLIVI